MKKRMLLVLSLLILLIPLKVSATRIVEELHSNVDNPFYIVEGESFSFQMATKENNDLVSYSILDGTFPEGITFTEEGLISGKVESIDYDSAAESGDNYALYNIEVLATDSSGEYSDTIVFLSFFLFESDTEWADLANLKTDFEGSDNLMAVGASGANLFVNMGLYSYQILYNDDLKTFNIVAGQRLYNMIGFTNYNAASLAFPYSENAKLLKLQLLENVGFNSFASNLVVAANSCDETEDICFAYYNVGADLDYEGNTRHLYLKYYNPVTNDYYKINYSLIYYTDYFAMFETNSTNFVPTEDIYPGDKITEPTDPTKTGYTFVGWYSDEDLTSPWDFDTIPEESVTLYAKWEEVKTTSFVTTDNNHQFVSDTPLSSLYVFHVDDVTSDCENVDTINASLENKEVIKVVDIYLKDDSNSIVEVSSGNYEVKIKLTADLLNYTNYKVGYLNPNTNEISEWFDVTVTDGYLTFNTTHLSEYVIVGTELNNPNTLDNIYKYIIGVILSAACLTTTLVILKKRSKKH